MVRGGGWRKKSAKQKKGAASLTLSLPNPPPFLPSSHFDTCHAGYLDTITGVNTGSFNRKYRKKRLKQTKPSVPFTKGVRLTQGSTVFELFLLYPAPHARVLHLWERYSLSLCTAEALMGESKRANSRPEGAYREIISRHDRGILRDRWERETGNLENGNKVEN